MEPGQKDLFKYGVIAEIKQLLKLPSGALRILVEGLARAKVETIIEAPAVDTYFRLMHCRWILLSVKIMKWKRCAGC